MRIAVIGTGRIGGTLGRALARAGHDVTYGSRHPQDADVGDSAVTDVGGALAGADAVLLALPGDAVGPLLQDYAPQLDGTLVIDATNNVGAPSMNASAAIAAAVPGARYVRAFNTLGWENFDRPSYAGETPDLFFSAPAADRATVEQLISDVGLRPAYLGAGKEDVVDSVLQLWFALVQDRGTRHLAFRVLQD
jgi:8-hydroxy-5-deazaflavin:NADPH oxidoreductase